MKIGLYLHPLTQRDFLFARQVKTLTYGTLAQLVEQRTENPCVPGSIPGGTTFKSPNSYEFGLFAFANSLLLKVASTRMGDDKQQKMT